MTAKIYGLESLVDISLDSGARLTLSDGPLQLGWRHSGMTSDFIAEIMALPYSRSKKDYLQAHHDIGYLSNELIENAVKFRQPGRDPDRSPHGQGSFFDQSPERHRPRDHHLAFSSSCNACNPRSPAYCFLSKSKPTPYRQQAVPGLGLLTLLSDYDARMAWTFEENNDEQIILTTTAAVAMPPSSNL